MTTVPISAIFHRFADALNDKDAVVRAKGIDPDLLHLTQLLRGTEFYAKKFLGVDLTERPIIGVKSVPFNGRITGVK